jgi:hypothetical protein
MMERFAPLLAPRASSPGQHLRLVLSAWGSQDVRILCELTLPTLMSPGNLPTLEPRAEGMPVTMCCLSRDRAIFERFDSFNSFAGARTVDWHFIDDGITTIGDAREAVLAEAFRFVMSAEGKGETAAFILMKPGTILADGGLAFVVDALRKGARAVMAPVIFCSIPKMIELAADGAKKLTPRNIVRVCQEDPGLFTSSFCGTEKPWGWAPSDRLAAALGDGNQILMTARWHPLALRPATKIVPLRQSLLDSEIVPEFVADEAEVSWAKTSDEVLLVDVRSEAWLSRRFEVENLSDFEVVARIREWATPWQLRALSRRYRLLSRDPGATELERDPFAHLPATPSHDVAPERHPNWLAARGLRPLSPTLGADKRYQSALDHYYRAARLAIEASEADEVIYMGHAPHVFATLLSRLFSRAYVADLAALLAGRRLTRDPSKATLCVIHTDLHTFVASFLFDKRNAALLALAREGLSVLLIVESPDSHGGLATLDRAKWRYWYEVLVREAKTVGASCRIGATTIDFFHGHPGFTVGLAPLAQEITRGNRREGPTGAALSPANQSAASDLHGRVVP